MEVRLVIAYGLIVTMMVAGAITFAVWRKRQAQRRLRMAGIKKNEGLSKRTADNN